MRAVTKNPRQADYGGLDGYLRRMPDAGGMIRTPAADKHLAEELRSEAQVMKQNRLHVEETTARDRAGGGGGDNNKKKKKGEGKGKDEAE